MASSKTTAPKTRKSKAEVQADFEKLEKQVEAKKSDFDPKGEELIKGREIEVKEAVADLSVESIVQKIGSIGVEISKHLSDVSSRLITGSTLLQTLREAVALERKELDRLHQIDTAKMATDLMVAEYQQTKESLENEMQQARSQWVEEIETKDKEKREFEENLKKQRTREKEEYEYQKLIDRKKDEDQYKETQRIQERKNKDRQELLEKSWLEKESSIKEREAEFAKLRNESLEYPERLKAEVTKAVQEAVKAEKERHHQQFAVLQKEVEAERKLAEFKSKGLEEIVSRQYSQIDRLSDRLEEAKKQVQEIAIKAIEGASGARALSHVNQIAIEQAKTRGTPNA